jgi:alcohol dehydrogenase
MGAFKINLSPNILFGTGSHKQLGQKLKEFGCKKALLIYDMAMGDLGHADELVRLVKAEGVDILGYQTEAGEPGSNKVDKVYLFAQENKVDGIIGFGGGSTMDTAKFVGLLLANGGKAHEYLGYANNKASKIFSPIITMPTTSGTGAEVTFGLVCNNDEKQVKSTAMSSVSFSIIDPAYTLGLPKDFTAGTGIDALAHALESVSNTKDIQHWIADTLGAECIRLCFKWLPVAYSDGKNLEAREWMSYAALLGGYTISNRKTTYGHLFASEVSNKYHFPHNIGVSLALSSVVRYNAKANPETNRIVARAIGIDCPKNADMTKVGQEIVVVTDHLQKTVGMKTMKELGLDKAFLDETIPNMAKNDKWKVVPAQPDWELVRESLYEAFEI